MKHEWNYTFAKDHNLLYSLAELESEGWEIFAITHLVYSLFAIISRKEQSND